MITVRRICALPIPDVEVPSHGNVDIWFANLNQHEMSSMHSVGVLSDDERLRLKKLRFAREKRHFSVRRSLLRILIGGYLGIRPERVKLVQEPYGKPQIVCPIHAGELQFNLSYSEDICAFAFTRRSRVGIDVEFVRTGFPYQEIVSQFFTTGEAAMIMSCSDPMRTELFYRLWTFKEACVKADGRGLSIPLNCFHVPQKLHISVSPSRRSAINLGRTGSWIVFQLLLGPTHVGALAVEAQEEEYHES